MKFVYCIGSRGTVLQGYSQQMADLLRGHSMELGRTLTVVDLWSGGFTVGRALLENLPGSEYIGCDIVPELIAHNNASYASDKISFRRLDLVSDPLPDGDVCLVRQVLQHLSNADIMAFTKRAD